jgi:hypothetical protein
MWSEWLERTLRKKPRQDRRRKPPRAAPRNTAPVIAGEAKDAPPDRLAAAPRAEEV